MHFIETFKRMPRWLQIVLLVVPFVGWVVELLYRIDALIRKATPINIVGLILFAVIGFVWIGLVLDIISLILRDQLFFVEE